MGGMGSGSRNRWASKTDEFHRLDLADFKREWFERHLSGTVRWSRGGHQTGAISYRLAPDHFRLIYTVPSREGRREIVEPFRLAFTEQPLGGRRRWIVCPSCGRRCRVLYGGVNFRCRQCHRATYPSQYEPFRVGGFSAIDRVREKLGGEPGLANPFPRKPKGMHWRTYRRLEAADWQAAETLERVLASRWLSG